MPSIKDTINQVVVESLAELAFLDVTPMEPPADVKEFSHVLLIQFNRPKTGGMVLFLSKQTKQKVIENIYGDDWKNLTPNQIDDGLLEILNILSGNFLSAHFQKDGKYQMSLPQLLFELPDFYPEKKISEFFFDAEGDILKLAFWED